MQGTSLAVGCEQDWWLTPCVGQVDGWEMWGGCTHASRGGSCLGWAVSREGCGRGQYRISPKPKLKNILSHPAGLRGLLGATCCLDAAVRLVASIIKSHASC